MDWVYVVAAVAYIVVGVASVFAFELDNALQVVALVFLWPMVCVAKVLWAIAEGLTSRR